MRNQALITQPPPLLSPHPDEVHIWRFGLDLPSSALEELERLLTPDELERAECLRGPQLRSRFVAGRGLVRRLLERYVGSRPEAIAFTYCRNGKPSLAVIDSSLEFNLAHSEGRALLAVAQQTVGIDLEFVRSNLDIDAIASSVFTPLEQDTLRAAPGLERNRMFYTLWVRKEAVMKATGRGLSETPAGFSVVAGAAGPAMRVVHTGHREEFSQWHVYDLDVGLDSVAAAALAVAGTSCHRIIYFDVA